MDSCSCWCVTEPLEILLDELVPKREREFPPTSDNPLTWLSVGRSVRHRPDNRTIWSDKYHLMTHREASEQDDWGLTLCGLDNSVYTIKRPLEPNTTTIFVRERSEASKNRTCVVCLIVAEELDKKPLPDREDSVW